jgi:hypothetical protein
MRDSYELWPNPALQSDPRPRALHKIARILGVGFDLSLWLSGAGG